MRLELVAYLLIATFSAGFILGAVWAEAGAKWRSAFDAYRRAFPKPTSDGSGREGG